MGVQQTSFDFFNLPPEKGKSEEKVAVKNVEEVQKVQEVQEAQEVVPDPGTEEEVERFDEAEEMVIAGELEKEQRAAEVGANTVDPVIVEEEKLIELDFVVKKPKASPVKTGLKSTRGRMKLSEMDTLVDLVVVPEDTVLFQKRYYNIGAVSEMFKVNISLIRFWENEFDILKPKKNGKGDRLFRPEDIKNLQLIYHLLREKKYTIEGAKDFLKKNKKADENFALIDSLKKMKSFLLELKSNL